MTSEHDKDSLSFAAIDSDQIPSALQPEEEWSHEIKRRIEEVRSGTVAMIAEDEIRRRLAHRLSRGCLR